MIFFITWFGWYAIFTIFGDKHYGWLTANVVMSLFATLMTFAVVMLVNLIFQ